MNWIKCSERMPEIDADVLVWCQVQSYTLQIAYGVRTATYYGGKIYPWGIDDEWAYGMNVTHWQPLPGPPSD